MEFESKAVTVGSNYYLMATILGAEKNGARAYQMATTRIAAHTASGVKTIDLTYNGYHVVRIERVNGVYSILIDGEVMQTGNGVNNNFLGHSGLQCAGAYLGSTRFGFKKIKFGFI